MPNVIQVPVDGVDDILNAGAFGAGAIVRLQTGATQTGAFADVSGTGSTPTITLVAATRSYTGFDPNGIVSSWYRTRYENAGATRLSDWSAAFQVGDETAGLLCSLYDVQQELGGTQTANDNEMILEKIRQVSTAIQGYTGRQFARSPSSGTAVFYFDVADYGRLLRVPVGINTVSLLETAGVTQPDVGGVYTTVPSTDYFLRPTPTGREYGWPATRIELSNIRSSLFYPGFNTVRMTGALGWDAVPPDIQGIAIRATVRRFIGKSAGGVSVGVGPGGQEFLLPDMSGADRVTLNWYRDWPVA